MRSLRLLMVACLLLAGGLSISCNKGEHGVMKNINPPPGSKSVNDPVEHKPPAAGKNRTPSEPVGPQAPPIKR